jgi:hypothetical protein
MSTGGADFSHRSNGDQEGVVWSVRMHSRRVVDGVADDGADSRSRALADVLQQAGK